MPGMGWGHAQRSMFQKRVEPIIIPSLARTIMKGTAVPTFRHVNASSMYFVASSLLRGTGLHR
jgi:hypothetical protein